ncbi:MAG: SAM-dependent methyltransferase [Chloroflexota bacterium]|nr:SAM-dependent methyltransferase [Chloroflexota bacterium]
MPSPLEQEIRSLIRQYGRITFARFMQVCLYSPTGGFYLRRKDWINAHFGTSPTTHPVFGALIARQLEQMWTLMGEPPVFHVIEVGSGDSVLAQSVVNATRRNTPGLAQALIYVALDYQPGWAEAPDNIFDWPRASGAWQPPGRAAVTSGVRLVKGEGLRPVRNVQGCILSNELIDNFPVHRFAFQGGRVREVFVTLDGEEFAEVLDEPSTYRIEERLAGLGLSLPEGYRGEVNLAMEDWVAQISTVLERGFILTIDYGDLADGLYSLQNSGETLYSVGKHIVDAVPYESPGRRDITCQVDFTSLMRLGEQHGLDTVGYVQQRQFLDNLGISSYLAELENREVSAARKELNRIAMTSLVDPDDYGSIKVLAQSKGMAPDVGLMGFRGRKE